MRTPLISAVEEQISEFKANLAYTESSRTIKEGSIERPCLKTKQKHTTEKQKLEKIKHYMQWF